MNFGYLKLREKLENSGFYNEIIFDNEFVENNSKNVLAKWLYNMSNYKYIRIEKFRNIFNELTEIVFPITIKNCLSLSSIHIEIIDAEGKEYYFLKKLIYAYNDMEKYVIGRRNSSLEVLKEFYYSISKDGKVELIQTSIKPKQNGTNNDIIVEFFYNAIENTTEAELKSLVSNRKIRIKYPTNEEFDKKVLNFFLNSNKPIWYYYNVFPILKWLNEIMPNKKVSFSIIAEIEGEVFSKIKAVDGIVQEYIVTKIISEEEIVISRRILAQKIDAFLDKQELIEAK